METCSCVSFSNWGVGGNLDDENLDVWNPRSLQEGAGRKGHRVSFANTHIRASGGGKGRFLPPAKNSVYKLFLKK